MSSGMLGTSLSMSGMTLGRTGKSCLPCLCLRCRGRHIFPVFLEMSGKTCLPCFHLRCWGRHVFPAFLEMSGKDISSLSSLRCRGSHVFPIFLEMLGKTCLPCLPRDVEEDIWGCWGRQEHWGRHSRLSGRTSRRMGTTGKTLGDNGDIREGFNLLPEVPAVMGDNGDVREHTRG